MSARFELRHSSDGQYYFNLLAANNEVILTSERYRAKSRAQLGVDSVRRNAASDERYRRRRSRADEPYFVLSAANGEIIGCSEMYSSSSAMERGIEAVKRAVPEAALQDTT